MKQFISHSIMQSRMAVLGFATLVACSACSESGESSSKPASSVYISGGMIGEDGPVKNAEITATDAKEKVVATVKVEGRSTYRLKLPADTNYPVIISAIYPRSTKIVESGQGEIKAAVMEAANSMVELSPKSTRIVEIALARGGLTPNNFEQAASAAFNLGGVGGGATGGHGGH